MANSTGTGNPMASPPPTAASIPEAVAELEYPPRRNSNQHHYLRIQALSYQAQHNHTES